MLRRSVAKAPPTGLRREGRSVFFWGGREEVWKKWCESVDDDDDDDADPPK